MGRLSNSLLALLVTVGLVVAGEQCSPEPTAVRKDWYDTNRWLMTAQCHTDL